MRQQDLERVKRIERTMQIRFNDQTTLLRALTHRSYLNEDRRPAVLQLGHNERLELLGDALLEFITTEHILNEFPDYTEGELTALRVRFVDNKSLTLLAELLGLPGALLTSHGEISDLRRTGPRKILADAVEAIIGAIYLDQGLEVTRDFILRFILIPQLKKLDRGKITDPKSYLQERLQADQGITPTYRTLRREGPDHATVWFVGLFIEDTLVVVGKGNSTKAASINAAEQGIRLLGYEEGE